MFESMLTKVAITLLTAVMLCVLNNVTFLNQMAYAQLSNNVNPSITPRGGNQFFLAPVPGGLTNQWWDWIFSLDITKLAQQYNLPADGQSNNPFFDKTGVLCNAGLQQNGLLFLVGTAGVNLAPGEQLQGDKTYDRNCKTPITRGTLILIPVINSECSTIEFGYDAPCVQSPTQNPAAQSGQMRSQVNKLIDHATELNIAIDGVPLNPQRVQSPGIGHFMKIVPNNPFAVFGPPLNVDHQITVLSVADGYWVALRNLSQGTHTVQFGGAVVFPGGGQFQTEVTYHLTVV